MEALQNLLNGENGSAIQLVLITLFLVIGLILLVWIFRRIAGSPSRRAARNRVPRLSITDSAAVDDKRYLVLVRRDNVEHLVLIGGPTDVVVESGIVRVQSAVQPKGAEQKSIQEEVGLTDTEETATISAPVAATTAVAGTAVAAAASLAQPAIEAEEEISPEAQEFEEEQVEPVISSEEVAVDTPDYSPNDIEEAVANIEMDPQEFSVETSIDTAETHISEEAEVEIVEPEPVSVEVPQEPNLEEAISAQLDDALSSEEFAVEAASAADQPSDKEGNAEDDMQRLLDELAGETKEPA